MRHGRLNPVGRVSATAKLDRHNVCQYHFRRRRAEHGLCLLSEVVVRASKFDDCIHVSKQHLNAGSVLKSASGENWTMWHDLLKSLKNCFEGMKRAQT